MIYRIAIYSVTDGKRKFDHYASDEEMETLRVNAQGKVEELLYDPSISFEPGEMGLEPGYGYANIKIWKDISDTHEVEWGVHLTSTPIYENDIILIHDGDGICYEARYGVFPLMEFYTNYLVNGSPYCEIEVIGNIHEEAK